MIHNKRIKGIFKKTRWSFLFVLICILIPRYSDAQQLRHLENEAFQRGERLVYRVYYNSMLTGNVAAGDASLEILSENAIVDGRSTMHVIGEGHTRGVFNLFFKVQNRYETFIDEKAIVPLFFMRDVKEGSYTKYQNVYFNQFEHVAVTDEDTFKITPHVQDIISAFYFARTYNFDNAKPGDEFEVDFFLDDSVYVTRIFFEGREEVETKNGTFKTLKFKPMVLEGSVFSQPYPMTLWITDDKNKIPVLLESGLIVGNIRMELMEYKGLKNPVLSRIE